MRLGPIALLTLAVAACAGRDTASRAGDATRNSTGDSGGASAAATTGARIGACWGIPTIGEGGVGSVRVSRTIADAARTCTARDTTFTLGEGVAETGAVIRYGGHQIVAVTTGSRTGEIARILVADPAFRTAAGVGVGSTIGELRRAYGIVCPLGAEARRGVRVRGLAGVSFGVRSNDPTPPDTARVSDIWIYEPGLDAGSRCGA